MASLILPEQLRERRVWLILLRLRNPLIWELFQRRHFLAGMATAAAKRFNIVLKSCPASVTSASIRFDGATNTANPSILALTSGQTATNVGVALYEQDSATLIPVGSSSASVTLLEDVNNTLTYFAKYMATGTVGAGTANASTSFTVTYQ